MELVVCLLIFPKVGVGMSNDNTIEGLLGASLASLKSRFKAWVAPEQPDFYALIALADIGRQAVGGGAEPVSTGLEFNGESGPLCLALQSAGGLQLDDDSLKLRAGAGFKVDSAGALALALKSGPQGKGTCLAFAGNTCVLNVLKVDSSGLTQADGKLAVIADDCLRGSSGLALKLAPAASGLQLHPSGLAVRCNPSGGLAINAEGKLTLDLEFLMGIQ
jgi:hypothetical protein